MRLGLLEVCLRSGPGSADPAPGVVGAVVVEGVADPVPEVTTVF